MDSSPLLTWNDVPSLNSALVKSLTHNLGHETVTKVQSAVIPLFMQNKDVCVKACTGSGKTLAFLVPLLHKLYSTPSDHQPAKNEVLGLILAPSRELALQIHKVLCQFDLPEGL